MPWEVVFAQPGLFEMDRAADLPVEADAAIAGPAERNLFRLIRLTTVSKPDSR